jgi:hypothetical protein
MFLVAPEAKGSKVGQIAFASSFRNRKDVIRIPEAPPSGMPIQLGAQGFAFASGHKLETSVKLDRVQAANGADSAITRQYPVTEVPGVRSQPPLVDALIVAEGPPSCRHLFPAISADTPAVRTAFLGFPNPASGFFPSRTHF